MLAALDHLVINTRFETDEAVALFDRLGFTLSPRSEHNLGSINHLMVFERGYLELIGLPHGTTRLREEVLNSPVGIDGFVLATNDVAQASQYLDAEGFAHGPAQKFSRDVEMKEGAQTAHFQAVRLLPGQFPAGRVYYCQHETPQLIWQQQWLQHANGVNALRGLTIVSADPVREQGRYARLARSDAQFQFSVVTQAALVAQWGELAAIGAGRSERFAAITFSGGDRVSIAQRVAALGLPHRVDGAGVWVGVPQFAALLAFV